MTDWSATNPDNVYHNPDQPLTVESDDWEDGELRPEARIIIEQRLDDWHKQTAEVAQWKRDSERLQRYLPRLWLLLAELDFDMDEDTDELWAIMEDLQGLNDSRLAAGEERE